MTDTEIEIRKYDPSLKGIWDDFVENSKNGTFLFKRNYMDYHSDRFADFSCLIYFKRKLYCLMPACRKDDIVSSHSGLTYGGLIMNSKCTAEGILEVFTRLLEFLGKEGVKKLIYKTIPYIYTQLPSQEDLYALFRNNAKLIYRNISATIDRNFDLKMSRQRKRSYEKSIEYHIVVEETNELNELWPIIESNLQITYGAKPVHSLEEMKRLKTLFPQEIKIFKAIRENENLGCGVFYVTNTVVHAQYIHATKIGKELGAVDAIVNHILKHEFLNVRYFDFGTSNENGGWYLNESLIHTKEGFGARGICYDGYELTISPSE